jgi:DNA repair protein RAD5
LEYGDYVRIERAKPNQNRLKKPGRIGQPRQDVIVRFTNERGEEIGRLENTSASWMSTLLDQKICKFHGSCVFAPSQIRTNDNVFLQLRCYILDTAFDSVGFSKLDSNRETGIFETKESLEERDLRIRQVALVKLFEELSLEPSYGDKQKEKRKREALMKAAEASELHERQAPSSSKPPVPGQPSTPPSEEEDGEELEQDQLDSLYEKAQSFDFNTPELTPPSSFALDLRKYQRQALHWMVGKEQNDASRTEGQSMHPLWDAYTFPVKDVDEKDVLIIDGQERFYVNPYSGELSLDFPIQEQNCLGGILADGTLLRQITQTYLANFGTEMGLGKTIEMLALVHTNKAEGLQLSAQPSAMQGLTRLTSNVSTVEWAPATTLVVAPMSLLAQWESEAAKASRADSLRVLVYYGSDKIVDLRSLCCESNAGRAPNVIITSYGTVLSEYNNVATGVGDRGLFSLNYFRVILDEAHYIKNRISKTAKACFQIKARHRWVLTGTPIVNRLEDLFSLVHFLKVEPWSNFSYWKTFITAPFEAKEFIRALDVVQTVLEPLVMRRTKAMKTPDGEPLVPLPSKTIDIHKIELSKVERDIYNVIFARTKLTLATTMEAGTLLKSYATIFAQILRLRQSCCHPVLIRSKEVVADEADEAVAKDLATGLTDNMDLDVLISQFNADAEEQDAKKYGAHVLKQIQDEAELECPICSEEPMIDQAVTSCWHSACKKCLLDYIEHQKSKGEIPRCFNCREPINSRDIFEVFRHDTTVDTENPFSLASSPASKVSLRRIGSAESAKIAGLMEHLKHLRKEDSLAKSVIFSQFTSFLDLIEPALTRDRIHFLRLDGSMAQKQRAAVLSEFNSRNQSLVLLISLRAGGVGLNLTAAKRVFMMDPWWSFAVESQAIDRVHRMGQESEVKVTRFIVENSIEEKMLRIQERKKFM